MMAGQGLGIYSIFALHRLHRSNSCLVNYPVAQLTGHYDDNACGDTVGASYLASVGMFSAMFGATLGGESGCP